MFLFALKMCVADMKRVLHRFWWMSLFLLIMIVIAPFCGGGEHMSSLSYLIMTTIFLMIPRYSRIHFVVPLDVKQMKMYFLWRIAIVCGMILFIMAVFIGISEWQKWNWNPEGFLWQVIYLILYLIFSEFGLQGLGDKINKFRVRYVIAIVVGIVGLFIGILLVDYLPVNMLLVYVVGMLPLAIGDMFWYLREVKMEDYTYIPLAIWENGKKERD